MAIILADRVKESSITTGSGTLTLQGAIAGFQSFNAGIGDGNQTYYAIENEARWEVGIGTYTSSTLTRDTILQSSNSDNVVDLSGVSTVFCTYPAGRSVPTNASGWIDLTAYSGVIQSSDGNFGDLTVSGDFLFCPYNNQILTFKRSTSGNFFQAYIDDTYDRTIALHSDGSSSPMWKLGLKTSPNFQDVPPDHGYVYGEDGSVGLVANSTSDLALSNSNGFVLTHQSEDLLRASNVTGVFVNADVELNRSTSATNFILNNTWTSATSYERLRLYGQAADNFVLASEKGSAGGTRRDLTLQITNTNINNLYASGYISVSGGVKILDSVPSNTTNRLYNDGGTLKFAGSTLGTTYTAGSGMELVGGTVFHATGVNAVSGWSNYVIANSDAAISGWVEATFTTDASTTYTAGSGLELVGNEFNATGISAVSGWNSYITATGDAAVSGWAKNYIDNQDHSAVATSGWAQYYIDNQDHSAVATSGWSRYVMAHNNASGVAISGWADSTISDGDIATSGWAFYVSSTGDAAVSGWANSVASTANASLSGWANSTFVTTDTTYTAGSGMELVGTVFHATGVEAVSGWAKNYVDGQDHSAVAVSGWTQYYVDNQDHSAVATSGWAEYSWTQDDTAVSGWANATFSTVDTTYSAGSGMELVGTTFHATGVNAASGWAGYEITTGDAAVSGWARNYVDTQDHSAVATSGWAAYTWDQDDIALSGWAGATFVTTDTNTTYTAGSGMELVGTVFHATGVNAVSGWARNYVDTQDHSAVATSGWAEYTWTQEDIALSGWAGGTFSTTDTDTTYTAGSGMELVGTAFHNTGVNAVSGWAGYLMAQNNVSGVAISGWAGGNAAVGDAAVSGWARNYVDTQDHSAVATSGWAEYTWTQDDAAISGWANATFVTSDTDTTYTAGSGMELVGTVFHATGVNAVSGWAQHYVDTQDHSAVATSGWAGYEINAVSGWASASNGDKWSDPVNAIITPDGSGTRDFGTPSEPFGSGYFSKLIIDPSQDYGSDKGINWGTDGYASFYRTSQSALLLKVNNAGHWSFNGNGMVAWNPGGPSILKNGVSNTTATIRPDRDSNTGLGSNSLGEISLIAEDEEIARINVSGLLLVTSGVKQLANESLPFSRGYFDGLEVHTSGVKLKDSIPSTTTNTLYNNSSKLYFNGSPVDQAVSGWAVYQVNTGDVATSGWAKNYVDTQDHSAVATSGWAAYTWNVADVALSGWAGGTFSTTDTDTTYTAGSGMELVGTVFHNTGVNAVSGWADYLMLQNNVSGVAISGWAGGNAAIGDVAVSGWARNYVDTQDHSAVATSGWAEYTWNVADVALSGWADATFITTDSDTTYTAGSGMELVDTVFHATGVNAVSGWANYTWGQEDIALSGWTRNYVDTQDHSAVATSGWAGYEINAVSGWASSSNGDKWSDPVNATITPDSSGARDLGTTSIPFSSGYFQRIIINPANQYSTLKGLYFGTHDDLGFYSSEEDVLQFRNNGSNRWSMQFDNFTANDAHGPRLENSAATSINPTFIPRRSSGNTGVGANSPGQLSFITAGFEAVRVSGANLVVDPGATYDPDSGLKFGTGNTGFYEKSDNNLVVLIGGTAQWLFSGNQLRGLGGGTPAMLSESVSDTQPGFITVREHTTTGFGANEPNDISAIILGVETFRMNVSGLLLTSSGVKQLAGESTPFSRGFFDGLEAHTSGLKLKDSVPTSTTNTLYNNGGNLSFNGSPVDSAVSGWAVATFITTDSDTTYTAGSGMELVGTVFHATGVNAVSGWARNYVDTQDHSAVATSGWAAYTWNVADVALSGWAGGTFSTTDTDTTYTAGSGMELVQGAFHATGVNAVSGWAGYQVNTGDAAVSGWAAHVSATGDAAVSGWSNYTWSQDDTAISGWANATFITTDSDTTYTAGSGMELVQGEFHATGVNAVSGWAGYLMAQNNASGVAISGWTGGIVNAGDIATSGWAKNYIDNQDHSAVATSGWTNYVMYHNNQSGVAISGWAAATIAAQDHTDTTYTAGSGMELVGTVFHATGVNAVSGWAGSQVSTGDTAVSGWARNYVDTQDHSAVATSGWAAYTWNVADVALSGWAGGTFSTTDTDTTYTAGSGMELVQGVFHATGVNAVSGWADSTANTANVALSGWARNYVDIQDHSAVSTSGWAEYTWTQDDIALSGWADATFITPDNVNISGGDVAIAETADHLSSPHPGSGLLWVKNDSPNALYYTDDTGTDHQLTPTATADLYETIWAEEGGSLSTTNRQWSFGNGATGAINIVAMYDGTIKKAFIDAGTVGTDVAIDIMVNNSVADTATFTSDGQVVTFATPITISEGDLIGFQTGSTVTGTWSNVRVGVGLVRDLAALKGDQGDAGAGMITGISKNSGANVNAASRSVLNFIEGAGTTLTITDDSGGDEVDITIASSYTAGSGMELVDNTFHATGVNAVSGWADYQVSTGDVAVSGWAAHVSATGDAAVSGWASYGWNQGDIAVSGWAGGTFSTTDTDTTYTAGSGMELVGTVFHATGVNAVSGWAAGTFSTTDTDTTYTAGSGMELVQGVFHATGVEAVSGWAGATFSTTDTDTTYTAGSGMELVQGEFHATGVNAVSGWAGYQVSAGDTAVSGWAAHVSATGDAAVSGWANYSWDQDDIAVSGWAAGTFSTTDTDTTYTAGSGMELVQGVFHATGVNAASGWSQYTWQQDDVATSGWADYVRATGDAAVSGWAQATLGGGGDLWSDPVNAVITPDTSGTRNLGTASVPFASGFFGDVQTQNITVGDTFYINGYLRNSTDNDNAYRLLSSVHAWYDSFNDYVMKLDGTALQLTHDQVFGWGAGTPGGSRDTTLYRDDAQQLALRDGTNPTSFSVYSTYTSSTDYERIRIYGQTGANFVIAVESGVAGGSARDLEIEASKIGINVAPTQAFHIGDRDAGIGSTIFISNNVANTSNLARVWLQVADGGADAYSYYQVNGGAKWTFGIDNSDSDKFKFSNYDFIGTNDVLTFEAYTLETTVNSGLTVNGLLTASGSILLPNVVPSTTSNRLYNDGGTLTFNGTAVGGTTYTAGSGMELVQNEFHATGVNAVSGWAGYNNSLKDAWGDSVDAVITPDGSGTRNLGTTLLPFASGFFNTIKLQGATKPHLNTETNYENTLTLDMDKSNFHQVQLSGNITLAVTNTDVGQNFNIRLEQDGTGSRTVTWFNTIRWAGGSAPTLTTTANKSDLVGFIHVSGDGAINYYDGFTVGQNI